MKLTKISTGTGIVIAVVVLLILGGGYVWTNPGVLGMPKSIGPPANQVLACPGNPSPELSLGAADLINTGTSRTADLNVTIDIGGQASNDYALHSDYTIDATAGYGYVMFAHESTNAYTGQILKGNVTCEETQLVNFYTPTVGTAGFYPKNSDDGLTNSMSDAQDIGTGEKVAMGLDIKESTADRCIGTYSTAQFQAKLPSKYEAYTKLGISIVDPPNLNLCFDYNNGAVVKPKLKVDGVEMTGTDAPDGHVRAGSWENSTVCFDTGTTSICDYEQYSGHLSLELEAKSGINPNPTGAGSNTSDLNMQLYMPQVYKPTGGDYGWYFADATAGSLIITPLKGGIHVG